MADFIPVNTAGGLDEALARHEDGPTTLFLFDPGCFVNTAAYEELRGLPGQIILIDVRAAPEMARVVAEHTGVKHESPQVIVFHQGQAVWSASHFAITGEKVTRAVQRAAGNAG